MNGKNLLDKISEIDPKLIEDAEKMPRRKSRLYIGISSGAAAVAAAALIAVTAGHKPVQEPPVTGTSDYSSAISASSEVIDSGTSSVQEPTSVDNTPKEPPVLDFSKYKDLPKIAYSEVPKGGQGGGVLLGKKDGVVVQKENINYSELEQSSPWKGAELETMPVYMSHSTDLEGNLDKMYARAQEVAAALGIPEDSLEITDNYQDMTEVIERHRQMGKEHGATDEEIEELINRIIRGSMSQVRVEAENEDIRITVNPALHAYINFKGATGSIKLPDGYNFTNSATDEEIAALVDYFAEKYKGVLNYSKPTLREVNPYDGIYIYDSDGDLTQQIVNYWINSTSFGEHYKNNGELSTIRLYSDDNCEKLGDYPILTAEQAEAILKSNKFDDVMRMPANAKILKTDMVYKNLSGCTAVMPYYEFYVETDDEPFEADIVCTVYTIPAVPEEFIDMETKDYGVRA